MKTFYFNTGVTIVAPYGNQVRRGGVNQIPFDVSDEVPDDAELMYLCDNPELPDSKRPRVMVVPVYNTDMISKYAYFKTKEA